MGGLIVQYATSTWRCGLICTLFYHTSALRMILLPISSGSLLFHNLVWLLDLFTNCANLGQLIKVLGLGVTWLY
jgi:hypothetical protein